MIPKLKPVIFPSRIKLVWENVLLKLPAGQTLKGKAKRGSTERQLTTTTQGDNLVMQDTETEALPVGKYTLIITRYVAEPYAPIFPQIEMEIEVIEEK